MALTPLGTLSLPKRQSARVPPKSEKKLLTPRANRHSSWGFPRVKCRARGPGTQQVKNLHRVFQSSWCLLLFSPLVSEKDRRFLFSKKSLARGIPPFELPPCDPKRDSLVISNHETTGLHLFCFLLGFHTQEPVCKGLPFSALNTFFLSGFLARPGCKRANLRPCQGLHPHKWPCHAPGPGWVKRGRNPQHAHVHLSSSSLTGIIPRHP